MKKIILALGLIALMALITACVQKAPVEKGLAPGGTDVLPDIAFSQCLTQVKQENPGMTDQQASDNCYTIEALNQNDASICNNVVSESAKANCLALFE